MKYMLTQKGNSIKHKPTNRESLFTNQIRYGTIHSSKPIRRQN